VMRLLVWLPAARRIQGAMVADSKLNMSLGGFDEKILGETYPPFPTGWSVGQVNTLAAVVVIVDVAVIVTPAPRFRSAALGVMV
jgi:hypothetical protein